MHRTERRYLIRYFLKWTTSRRLTVLETGGGLDPVALFIGQGGRMLAGSGWDRVRWRAWKRMWVELAASAGFREGSCRTYRHATSSFCTYVDATVAAAQDASLAREVPDLHHAVRAWIRLLPAGNPAGSRRPHEFTGRLRSHLIW
ncbi:hypothetical protein [Streptomyces broussonetiae]|uniref:hypothetical protein n=1 Tax=Streptomyces broussonetiae TaxID=2686304 RepID=UPI0035D7C3C4